MTSYRKYFLDFTEFPSPKPVYVGNNNAILAYGQGTVNVDMKVNGKWVSNHLSEVWYVPEVSRNLFSVSETLAKGFVFRAKGNECSFTRDGHVRLRVIRTVNGLYALKMRAIRPEVPAENKTCVKEFLGQRGIQVCEIKESCDGCLYGKQQRGRFHERPSCPIVTRALIHADVCGPMQERSIGGSRYFVCFKDDFSRFRRVFFMESKSEESNCLKVFLSEAKTACHTIKEFLSDGGGEFKNFQVCGMLQSRGINISYSIPYTPEQNGATERENRTIVEAARSILHHKGLPLKLWAEAVNTTVYVLNRTGQWRFSTQALQAAASCFETLGGPQNLCNIHRSSKLVSNL
ncbi:Retrovirus-related Pol polyprotein from transposon TNT 1-94 [Araneus ventricosus]|uniref:Retrovirus-related Pol polyprotein from transposon TNT 1-94 n=1 Tax=Araneus ventricosus TaxID=182803 RepID=A0A4Y2NA26_ARAVE|nr:Retrovirus-related Pol polyprotein from transposon TNT 1-94 [Araneus ventricosus]